MRITAISGQLLMAFCLSLVVLIGLIGWYENVNIITGNGLYKAIEAEPWIADFRHARLNASNYLYFPLYGTLARLLDALGILPGLAFRQFAYLNAFFASLAVACVYAFVHRLTGSVLTAVLASLFHFGTGFFLLLAVISEDIMPGYFLVLVSMLLAALWFDRPTWRQIVLVGAIFTLGWLVEWRLLFPTLPALGLALVLSDGSWRMRVARAALLVVSIVATAGIVQQIWEGHNGAVGLHDLLWTGKGVDSAWAGISWDKAWMMLSGVGNYFLIMGGFVDPLSARRAMTPLVLSVALQAALFVLCTTLVWPRRNDRSLRATAIVFLGTLGAGQVMNFYSQPQDPQMQINVMPWLTVAWALLASALLAHRRALWPVLALVSLAPLAWNVVALSKWRGGDTQALAALAALEKNLPPDRTVYVYWGFEPITTWQYMLWSRTPDWGGGVIVGSAPSASPKFKWISLSTGTFRHPQWSGRQDAEEIRRQIDLAFRLGYRVVISGMWRWDVRELAGQLGVMSAADRAPPIHAALHDNYVATPVLTDSFAGQYYELQQKKQN